MKFLQTFEGLKKKKLISKFKVGDYVKNNDRIGKIWSGPVFDAPKPRYWVNFGGKETRVEVDDGTTYEIERLKMNWKNQHRKKLKFI